MGGWSYQANVRVDGEEVAVTVEEAIDATIDELVRRLAHANQFQSVQIRIRIEELESLKEKRVTT